MKRQDICDVKKCIAEILGSLDVKKHVKRSGLMCYELSKIHNDIEPIFDACSKHEKGIYKAAFIKNAAGEIVYGPDESPILDPKLSEKVQADVHAYFQKEEPKFKIDYLLNMEDSEIISQFLSGKSTIVLFKFLTKK